MIEKGTEQEQIVGYVRKSEIILIQKILINYCRENHDDISTLFKLAEVSKIRIAGDYSFLRKFFRNEVPEKYTSQEKKDIFLSFLSYLRESDRPLDSKINASYLIIYPLLTKSFKKGVIREIIDQEAIKKFTDFITTPQV